MNVYEFEKSLLTRLEESSNVLQCKDVPVPASQVLSEWAYHIELQIEPAGMLNFLRFCILFFVLNIYVFYRLASALENITCHL